MHLKYEYSTFCHLKKFLPTLSVLVCLFVCLYQLQSISSAHGKSTFNPVICDDIVQNCWNDTGNKLIVIVYRLAPMIEFHNNTIHKNPPPQTIQRKINCRKRLLQQLKCKPSIELKLKLKELNCKIKTFFHSQRKLDLRHLILPCVFTMGSES